MLEGSLIALALPLLMSSVPLMSLAVIAAIAVLVYEVRGFFGRSATGTQFTTGGGPTLVTTLHERTGAPANEATPDRVAALRPETMSPGGTEAPSLAGPARLPDAATPVHDPVTPAVEPAAPAWAPARQRAPDDGGGVDARLALVGAIVIALALLWLKWLLARAVRRRGDG